MSLLAGTSALRVFGAPMHMAMSHAAKSGGLCKHAVADQTSVPRLLDPSRLTPFVDALPRPQVLRPKPGEMLRIAMRESEQRLHRELAPTRLWTYGNSMPGPTIEARSGQAVQVEWSNQLPQKHFLPIDHHICGA